MDLSGPQAGAIKLPTQNQETLSGTNATVAGWGVIVSGGVNVDKPHKADVVVLSDAECRQTYGTGSIADAMMCAGAPLGGVDPCDGDYGGPLFTNDNGAFTLIGIASWDQECASAIYPAVYTQVSYFVDWINSNIGA